MADNAAKITDVQSTGNTVTIIQYINMQNFTELTNLQKGVLSRLQPMAKRRDVYLIKMTYQGQGQKQIRLVACEGSS